VPGKESLLPDAPPPSLEPLPQREFLPPQARHLLSRVGGGTSPRAVEHVLDLGVEGAVAHFTAFRDDDVPEFLVGLKPHLGGLTPAMRRQQRRARRAGDEDALDRFRVIRQARRRENRAQLRRMKRAWLRRLAGSAPPLQERLVLLWHDHFATQFRKVRDSALMGRQQRLFREHALQFRALAQGVIRDPAMLKFLDNDRNRKGRPNENLARELMELFTLGEGRYSEADIKEAARALTGYGVRAGAFRFAPAYHDGGAKTILGKRATFDGPGLVDHLLAQPAAPRWLAYKLYRHFVGEFGPPHAEAKRRVGEALAREIARHRYDLGPPLRRLLASRHFFSPALRGRRIKSPVEIFAGLARSLPLPERNLAPVERALRQAGQTLFDPPSVAGWPGGRHWLNTSTLFVRQNLCAYLLTGRRGPLPEKPELDWDPAPLLAGVDRADPRAVVDRVAPVMLGAHATGRRRGELTRFLENAGGPVSDARLLRLLILVTGLPEYQLG